MKIKRATKYTIKVQRYELDLIAKGLAALVSDYVHDEEMTKTLERMQKDLDLIRINGVQKVESHGE